MITGGQFDIISGLVFAIILGILVYKNRKSVHIQKILWPVFYLVMWRTNLGVPTMNKWGKKYGGLIRLFGYFSIGVGLIGMVVIFVSLVASVWMSFVQVDSPAGVALVLPGSNIPGIGVLSFWHWIISILVLAVIHEFAHGIVASAHDLPIKRSGPAIFGFFLPLIPAAYVEPDEKIMDKTGDHVRYSIIAAGPVINLVFGVIVLLIMSFVIAPIGNNISYSTGIGFDTIEGAPLYGELGEGHFVLKEFEGEEVNDYSKLHSKLISKRPGENVSMSDGVRSIKVTLGEHPEDNNLPYLGVVNVVSEKEYYNSFWGWVFEWFRDLFKWLAALNIFVGLANLLPLGPVDGGQMLRVFLENTMKNKKKAMMIWGKISLLTLVLLLLGLVSPLF
jgi:hypothetical protein